MARPRSSLELALPSKPKSVAAARWLYGALRESILEGRLRRGTRLPATRDLAAQHGIARGTTVAVFEQLASEGYVRARPGAGTYVNERLPEDLLPANAANIPAVAPAREPAPSGASRRARAFRPFEPALDEFPMALWSRVASRRLRRASLSLLGNGDARGYRPLREAVAGYLGASRGVRCAADQVIIVSGVQQGLDLVARLVLQPGDRVWVEDPGYPGAMAAIRAARAQIIAVPVDDEGLDVAAGRSLCPRARAAYVTPAHQFPMGAAMTLDRRLALLDWARREGAFVLEDDYDSEYRYSGRPLPALQSLDPGDSVIFLGSFNKVLFPSLRLGYLVLPSALIEPLAALRFNLDRASSTLDQAILCDFIAEGHFGRHLRRMRERHGSRFAALAEAASRHLDGLLEVREVEAGLQTAALLRGRLRATDVAREASARELELSPLDRFFIDAPPVQGFLLGFAAVDEREIRRGVGELAALLARL